MPAALVRKRIRMLRLALSPLIVLLCAPFAAGVAAASSQHAELLLLAPAARMEQRCNAKAMGTIDHEHREMHPDELVAYAFSDPRTLGNTLTAPGAAVRSGGRWYHLSYVCKTTGDGTEVAGFTYSLGDVVPKAEWEAHYLVP